MLDIPRKNRLPETLVCQYELAQIQTFRPNTDRKVKAPSTICLLSVLRATFGGADRHVAERQSELMSSTSSHATESDSPFPSSSYDLFGNQGPYPGPPKGCLVITR